MIKFNHGLTIHTFNTSLILFFISTSLSQPFFEIQKNFTNNQQIIGTSAYGSSFMIWTSGAGIWESYIYNPDSTTKNFPFDSLNYIYNISDQTPPPIMSQYWNGNFFSLIQQQIPVYCQANINQDNLTGICHTWPSTFVDRKFLMANIYDGLDATFYYGEVFISTNQTELSVKTPSDFYPFYTSYQTAIDMDYFRIGGDSQFLLLVKRPFQYDFITIDQYSYSTIVTPLVAYTGFDQYAGMKTGYGSIYFWTEKTAYLFEQGYSFLSASFNHFIMDMEATDEHFYILTTANIFQLLKSDFSIVNTVNGTFAEHSSLRYIPDLNKIVCSSEKLILVYALQYFQPEPQPQPQPQPEPEPQPEPVPQQQSEQSQQSFSLFDSELLNSIVIVSMSSASVLRPSKLNSVFLFLANLDLYNFHKTKYQGYFGYFLEQVNIFQNQMWNFLPSEEIADWIKEPFPLKNYQQFSNQKFVEINDNDGLFVQNTKAYFILWLSVSFFVFFLLNRLFSICKRFDLKKTKNILIGYSFWTNFVIMAIIQNSYTLVFYSFQNFSLLFFFSPSMKCVQIISISIFGLIFLFMVQVFPLCPYFQGRKVKHLISNPKFISSSTIYGFLKYFLKIMVECVIHFYFYQSPGVQKISLSLINFFSVTMFAFFDFKYSLFGQKVVVWAQNIGEFMFGVFNMVLYYRYDYGEDTEVINVLIDSFQFDFMILYGCCVLVGIFFPLVTFIISKLKKKKKFSQLMTTKIKKFQTIYENAK